VVIGNRVASRRHLAGGAEIASPLARSAASNPRLKYHRHAMGGRPCGEGSVYHELTGSLQKRSIVVGPNWHGDRIGEDFRTTDGMLGAATMVHDPRQGPSETVCSAELVDATADCKQRLQLHPRTAEPRCRSPHFAAPSRDMPGAENPPGVP
jgi:hypothetical protein